MKPEAMEMWFKETTSAIAEATTAVLNKQPRITVVYLVGGFSASPLLQSAVGWSLGEARSDVKVVVPPKPGLAIVSDNFVQLYDSSL